MSNVLEGKTAIITGAGSGMGLATARLFHQHGANIVLADFSGAQEKTAVELGDRTVPIQADISNAADAKAMVEPGHQRIRRTRHSVQYCRAQMLRWCSTMRRWSPTSTR